MVGGFNTNVRYRGRTFHVQTEDSGPNVAKIVTLLYEGGSILFSTKTGYRGDAPGSSPAAVRGLMETQHREMVEGLKAGNFDVEIGLAAADGEDEVATPRPSTAPAAPPARAARPQPQPPARTPAAAPRQPPAPAARAAPKSAGESVAHREFGQGVITQKPLDEVVLAHLALK